MKREREALGALLFSSIGARRLTPDPDLGSPYHPGEVSSWRTVKGEAGQENVGPTPLDAVDVDLDGPKLDDETQDYHQQSTQDWHRRTHRHSNVCKSVRSATRLSL